MKSNRLLSALFALFTFFTLSTTLHAQDYEYIISEGSVTITKYTGSESTVVIPNTIEGLPVTSIGDETFYQNNDLTDLTISDNVISIGEGAFYDCEDLAYVSMGNSVTTIGDFAFYNCTKLASIQNNWDVDVDCDCVGHDTPPMGESITSIGDEAFRHCESLQEIVLPTSLTSIGDQAFAESSNLESIYFLGNAPRIGDQAFHALAESATIYYNPGASGWDQITTDIPTMLDPQKEPGSPFINVSTRSYIASASSGMVAGFVVEGTEDMQVLIQGVGPELVNATTFGSSTPLADPIITLVDANNDQTIATNDNWETSDVSESSDRAAKEQAMTDVGSFVLTNGSQSSAILETLAPGIYTVQLTGFEDSEGIALIEVYQVP